METMNLKCTLLSAQLDERRDVLANQVEKLGELEEDRKDAAASYKKKIDELELEMSAVAKEIRERAEYRDVEVKREKNYSEGTEETIRLDTGEVVSTRVLEPKERQIELLDSTGSKKSIKV